MCFDHCKNLNACFAILQLRQYVFIGLTMHAAFPRLIDEDVLRSLTRDATHNLLLVSLSLSRRNTPSFLNAHQHLDLLSALTRSLISEHSHASEQAIYPEIGIMSRRW